MSEETMTEQELKVVNLLSKNDGMTSREVGLALGGWFKFGRASLILSSLKYKGFASGAKEGERYIWRAK